MAYSPNCQDSPIVDLYTSINGTYNLLVFIYNIVYPNNTGGSSSGSYYSIKYQMVSEDPNAPYSAAPLNASLLIEFSDDNFATIGYSQTLSWAHNQVEHAVNGIAIKRPLEGSTITVYKTRGGWSESIGVLYEQPYTNKSYKIRLTLTSSQGNVTSVHEVYAPFTLGVTVPATVYCNRVNQFQANIKSRFTSKLEYHVGNSSSADANIPVRNANPPYITSGQETNYIYLFPNRSAAFEYTLVVYLYYTNADYPDQLSMVACSTVNGNAVVSETPYTDGVSGTIVYSDPADIYADYGVFLRNTDSRIRTSISAVPSYGVWYEVKKNAADSTTLTVLYSGNDSYQNVITELLPSGSSISIAARIQSTLKTISASLSASILDYYVPSFPNLAIHRCDENGSADDSGDHCKIEWSVNIMPINNLNSKKLTIQHPSGKTEYNPLSSYAQSGVLVVAASTESSYSIVFTVEDDLNTETRTLLLSSAGVIMDWLRGGTGVAFGKVASRQLTVEISELWQLMCYKLMLSGVDVEKWMDEMLARMQGIEQFASNLGSTAQYQVTLYNDSQILSRQWVLSGNDAQDLDETPEREATETAVYSFVGWALTNGATTANPNALTNITAYRNVYAAFTSSVRYYSVFYWNGSTLIDTVGSIQYHNDATFSGTTPTSDDGVFVGWRKSGRYISGNTDAYAQFYDDTEITDSWAEIVQACSDGTYATKYKQGNYKMLDLGTEGNIKMRIKGFKLHTLPGGNKAPISWEADTKLTTNKRMNPTAVRIYDEDAVDGYTYGGMEELYFYYTFRYTYVVSTEAVGSDNAAEGTFEITLTDSATVTIIGYETSYAYHTVYAVVTVDDVQQYAGYITLTNGTDFCSFTMSANTTKTVKVETYITSNANRARKPRIWIEVEPDTYVRGSSPASITFTTNKVDKSVGFETGTGVIGGFAESELHGYLQNTIKPLFPQELLAGLRKIRLTQSVLKSVEDYPNYKLVEDDVLETDLFIPSSDEIVGANAGNTKGVDFDVQKYQYRKKGNTSSVSSYWCRDSAYPARNVADPEIYGATIYGYSNTDGNAYKSSTAVTTARPVYIAFCT